MLTYQDIRDAFFAPDMPSIRIIYSAPKGQAPVSRVMQGISQKPIGQTVRREDLPPQTPLRRAVMDVRFNVTLERNMPSDEYLASLHEDPALRGYGLRLYIIPTVIVLRTVYACIEALGQQNAVIMTQHPRLDICFTLRAGERLCVACFATNSPASRLPRPN